MTYPLPGANWSYLHSLRLVATTGATGFALQNGTPNIISWTAPSDGNMHRVVTLSNIYVTSAETGGILGITWTNPNSNAGAMNISAGGQGTGVDYSSYTVNSVLVKSGSTVTVKQTSALTAGAATLWAEIWAY